MPNHRNPCVLQPAHAVGLVQRNLSIEHLMQEAWNHTHWECVVETHTGFFTALVGATDRINVSILDDALKTAFPQFTPKSKMCLG